MKEDRSYSLEISGSLAGRTLKSVGHSDYHSTMIDGDEEAHWRSAQSLEFRYWEGKDAPPPESRSRYTKIREMLGEVTHNGYVLDVGGGPYGGLLLQSSERVRLVVLDPLASSHSQIGGLAGLSEFIVGVGESLPFSNNTFDAIVSVNAIDHSNSPRVCLKEMQRTLKPGGRIGIMVHIMTATQMGLLALIKKMAETFQPSGGRFWDMLSSTLGVISQAFTGIDLVLDRKLHPHFFTSSMLRNLFSDVGIEEAMVSVEDSAFRYKKEYFAILVGTNSHTQP